MHEVGIMMDALAIAAEQARASGGARIHCVRLRVGALSGVVRDALEFAFETLSQGTMAEGGTLEIEEVPARWWCSTCQQETQLRDLCAECPQCHTLTGELRGGRELEVMSVEIS